MERESEQRSLVLVEGADNSGMARWAPLAVVLTVVGGFVALSWYAYHAGMQSVREEDLLVVEADKSPIKERPADPGGMQFPNQDKTIFDTFGSNGQPTPPAVERVLPKPEEPSPKALDTSETSTYVNNNLHKGAEQVIGSKDKDAKKADAKTEKDVRFNPDHQVIKAQANEDESVTYIAPRHGGKPEQALDNAVKTAFNPDKAKADKVAADKTDKADKTAKAAKPVETMFKTQDEELANQATAEDQATSDEGDAKAAEAPKPAAAPKEDVKPVKEEEKKPSKPAKQEKRMAEEDHDHLAPAAGKFLIQLGAYRSEKEARDAWGKMHIKQKELSDKEPVIIRADLGEKGIYYRLRATGFDSGADAKDACKALSAKGQACLIPMDK